MKKIFGILAATLLLASCSSDDDGNSINMDNLEKKWYPVSTRINGVNIPYDDHEECGNDYLEFHADGTVTAMDIWDCEEWVDEGTYTVDGNNITLEMYGESQTVTVTKLSSTDFSVRYTDTDLNTTVTENYKSSL